MRRLFLIAQREASVLARSPAAYAIAALVLFVDGLLFNVFAIGAGAKLSSEVLEDFFAHTSGTTMIAAILVGMRPLAEERASGVLVLLTGSPARSHEIVLGKFSAAYAFMLVLLALTAFMPALLVVHGRVSLGQVLTGYAGLAGLAAVALALGLLGSAFARSQLVAGMLGGVLLVTLLLGWLLARLSEAPLSHVFAYMALWQTHFLPLQRGVLRSSALVYMASVTVFALYAASLRLGEESWD